MDEHVLDEETEKALQEVRQKLFDTSVEDEQIERTRKEIKQHEELRANLRSKVKNPALLNSPVYKDLEKNLDEMIKSGERHIENLKKNQDAKNERREELAKMLEDFTKLPR